MSDEEEEYDTSAAYNQNRAFVFIKPHANTAETQALVSKLLTTHGVEILIEGEIEATDIDDSHLIDQQ